MDTQNKTQREIKFRAWDNEDLEMTRWETLVENHTELVDLSISPERFTFLQFTGLKDKNGVEIYDGDIFTNKFYDYKGGLRDGYQIFVVSDLFECNVIKEVGVDLPQSRFTMFYINTLSKYPSGVINELEIVGNIYENPELLTNN